MAAGTLPSPGSKFGPCLPTTGMGAGPVCTHVDCALTRRMAESLCDYCGKAIGYDVRFYDMSADRSQGAPLLLAHASCAEDEAEKMKDDAQYARHGRRVS